MNMMTLKAATVALTTKLVIWERRLRTVYLFRRVLCVSEFILMAEFGPM